jgi:hypothetical protein
MVMEEPKLEQFGLTEEKYDYLKKNKDEAFNKVFFSGIFITIAIASYLYLKNPNNSDKTIISLIAGWILICVGLGGLGGSLLGGIISAVYSNVRDRFVGDYRNLNLYEETKRKYDSWWIRKQAEFWTSLSGKRFEQEFAFLYSKIGSVKFEAVAELLIFL